jgi:hypothetical protein
MAGRPQILASAQAQFPTSANKTVIVNSAWRREDSTLDHPAPNGPDGWTTVGLPATYEVVKSLREKGFTWINLETGGTAWGHRDVLISRLI